MSSVFLFSPFLFLSVSVWHALSERRRGRDSAGSSIINASLLAWGEDIIYPATFVPLGESDNLLMLSNQWSNLDPPKRSKLPGTDSLCYTSQALKLYTTSQKFWGEESGKRRLGLSIAASNLSTTLLLRPSVLIILVCRMVLSLLLQWVSGEREQKMGTWKIKGFLLAGCQVIKSLLRSSWITTGTFPRILLYGWCDP